MTERDAGQEELLDQLLGEYLDLVRAGLRPEHEEFLERAPEESREALSRCLRLVTASDSRGDGDTADPVPQVLAPGARVDRYRILQLVGQGGMASVYRALDEELDRPVALKILRPELAAEPRHVERLRREARAIARLDQPGIVQVHAVGVDAGRHFLAMEWIDGPNLREVLARLPSGPDWTANDLARASGVAVLGEHRRTAEQALASLLLPAVRGLAAAHGAGLIHRDIKPSNILIHPDGRSVIADFGLAKGETDPGLSQTGELLGTPHYMSPEQVTPGEAGVDQRTDLYSLGVTLFEGLCGRRPFRGDTTYQVLEAIRHERAPGLLELCPAASRNIDAVIERSMAREPARRHRDATELLADLEAVAAGEPSASLRRRGGVLLRAARGVSDLLHGRGLRFRSRARILGWPLLDIRFGRRGQNARQPPARGVVAIGSRAFGLVAIGGLAVGGVSCGIISVGLVSLAAALASGILAVGLAAALGLFAAGGVAAGFAAVGGFGLGEQVIAGRAIASHEISGSRRDPAAVEWFDRHAPWLLDRLPVDPRKPSTPDLTDSEREELEMLKTTLATVAWMLPVSEAPIEAGTVQWEHHTLKNGVAVSLAHVEEAANQTFFTFLPLGLGADEAGRAQYSHLVEHMLIRSTDPDALEVDGIRINGETTALCMRLESIAPQDRWRDSLDRHGRWLAADEFDADVLEREKKRIEGEEVSTVSSGFTAKWADAAWNQVVRHGRNHAAIHGDLADASVGELTDYVRRRVPVGAPVRLVGVGPVPSAEILARLEAGLGQLAPRSVEQATADWDGKPADHRATWDLNMRHYIEWYRLPDRGGADRAGAILLAQFLSIRLTQNRELRGRGMIPMAGADLVTPEGRFLKITSSFRTDEDLELLRGEIGAAIEDPFASAAALGGVERLVQQISGQLARLPDFDMLRRTYAGQPSADLLEAQVSLTQMNHRMNLGLFEDQAVNAAHEQVDADYLEKLAELVFREGTRSTLILDPAD